MANELLVRSLHTVTADTDESRSVDAPPGVQHLENFAKLITLHTPRYGPDGAQVATDDAVLIDAGTHPPDVVGNLTGGVGAIARVTQNFTTTDYTASVEYAPPMILATAPFDTNPYVISNADGEVRIGFSTTPAGHARWTGKTLLCIASLPYTKTHPDCPQYGHLIPATAQGRVWLPRPSGAGALSVRLSRFHHAKTGAAIDLIPGTRYFLTGYLTSMKRTTLPTTPGHTRNRLSYPTASLSWVQA